MLLLIAVSCRGGVQVDAYRPLARPHPSEADSWYNSGVALTVCGRDSLAAEAFSRAVGLNPDDADSWFNLGVLYALAEQREPAAKAFSEALRRRPAHTKHFTLGLAYYSLGRYAEAIPEFRRAIENHEPHPVTSHVKLGSSCYALGRYQEGAEAFVLGARSNPEAAMYYNAWFSAGMGYQLLGRSREAMDAYRQAIRTRPDFVDSYLNLGVVSLIAGDVEGAKEQAAALRNLNPEAAVKLETIIRSGVKREKM